MFESLTDKLQGAFKRFGSRGVVTEADLDQALREVRMAMLEADVNFKVVREFTSRVKEKALGAQVLRSLTPAQQVIGIVHDELVELLGGEAPRLESASKPPTVLMVVGLQGSGKTTSIAKLANLLKKEGQRPLVVACDVYRPAAVDQLVTLARQLDIPCHEEGTAAKPAQIAANGLDKARRMNCTHVLVDTAGRLHIDEEMMSEVAGLRQQLGPQEVLFVADAMAGQDAVTAAREFHEKVGITGLVLTKMDGDARGGAALSIRQVTGVPVKFIGVGEKAEALEPFHPDRMAGRILGMGDMMTLIERARLEMGDEDTDKFGEKFKKGTFDLQDFLEQLRKVRRMGPLGQLVQMLPGFNRIKAQLNVDDIDDRFFKQAEAIVLSMTPWERRHPDRIDGKRRKRIARGSGTDASQVNQVLKQFFEARKIAKSIATGKFPALPGMR
ncbi:MAG: signal recognition particle protein [Dehalococcoidia bacterium]|nr:signal recognition particle protein [Chloroflexi bacterium CFX7]MCK6564589.1 signal recognition particle protein [Dehalococcoidia bacterium]NUQ56485.1 signal recognition particle protein [Dehalococcoidia bacterium]RIL02286.1 MAG: signal recognition particle protein [bacterium]